MENGKFILYKKKNIYYRILGKGKPVVLLHGFCEDGNIWNKLIEGLQENFQFIIPDLPGSGRSEMLEGEVSLIDYADAVQLIIEKELSKVSPAGGDLEGAVTMIGHSMGGYITLAFAEKYPKLLNSIGLFHSSAFADDDAKKETRQKSIEFIKDNGVHPYLRTSVPNLFSDKQHPEIEMLIENGKNFTPEALIQYLHAMMNRPDRTNILKSFNKPVLFIIGEKDNAVPLQASLQQCHLPKIACVNILEDAVHMGMIEQADRCRNFILFFLKDI